MQLYIIYLSIGKEGVNMLKAKLAELIVAAVAALAAAAKAVLRFIGCIGRMRTRPAEGAA